MLINVLITRHLWAGQVTLIAQIKWNAIYCPIRVLQPCPRLTDCRILTYLLHIVLFGIISLTSEFIHVLFGVHKNKKKSFCEELLLIVKYSSYPQKFQRSATFLTAHMESRLFFHQEHTKQDRITRLKRTEYTTLYKINYLLLLNPIDVYELNRSRRLKDIIMALKLVELYVIIIYTNSLS